MAQAYAQRIRTQQPQGPYYLLGWSLGGALTQLVAHELESQGQTVAFAGLVDSYVAGTAEAGDWREDLADFLKFVLGQPSEEAQALIASKAAGLNEREGAAAVIEAAMHGANGHAALGASELTQIFATGSSLKQLALSQRQLPKIQSAPIAGGWPGARTNAGCSKPRSAITASIVCWRAGTTSCCAVTNCSTTSNTYWSARQPPPDNTLPL